jgi:enoyl-CoA hydratase/carnithine racemase
VTSARIQCEQVRGIDVLTLASPRNRNAMSLQMLEEMLTTVGASAAGTGRALLLDHEGPVFCAGIDLKERRAVGPDDDRHSTLLAALLQALWAYPKPVLCRIDGPVRGGGMGLVACADVAVASARASFAYSEVRVGVAPALVAAVAFAKLPVGPLLPWLLTGEAFDATTAQRLGLVSRVDPTDELSVEPELAAVIASAPAAVRTMKQLSRRGATGDFDECLAHMQAVSAQLFASAEAREGMTAFAERRLPEWAIS